MEACLEIINKRNYSENHPSPRSSSSATKRQVVLETNLSSPAPSQPPNPSQWQEAFLHQTLALCQRVQLLTIERNLKLLRRNLRIIKKQPQQRLRKFSKRTKQTSSCRCSNSNNPRMILTSQPRILKLNKQSFRSK